MSERSARLIERGLERFDSAESAWESLSERREDIDWDYDAVRADHSPSVNRFTMSADDD